jgi:hypothetical protein
LLALGDFDLVGMAIPPDEANAPMIIDADAVLIRDVACDSLYARRNIQVGKSLRRIHHQQFPVNRSLYRRGQPGQGQPIPDRLAFPAAETANHGRAA